MNLRAQVIRLAHEDPTLRPHLLTVLAADSAEAIMALVNKNLHTLGDGPDLKREGRKLTTTYTTGILEAYRDEPGHRIDDQDDGYKQEMDEDAERQQKRLWDLLDSYDSSIDQIKVKRSPKGRGLMDLEITLRR